MIDDEEIEVAFVAGTRAGEVGGASPYQHPEDAARHHWWSRGFAYTARLLRALGCEALRDAVTAWRNAKCSPTGEPCDGELHREDCPVELARQDVLAAHNTLVPT